MAITAGVCDSFLLDLIDGTHATTDTFKIALYLSTATIGPTTTAYTATGEVTGTTNYTAGGQNLTGYAASLDTGEAIIDFADASWASSTIPNARGALIYNSTKADAAVAVLDFGGDVSSTNGTFTVTFPAPNAGTGLIRLT